MNILRLAGLLPALYLFGPTPVAWSASLVTNNFVVTNLNADGSVTRPSSLFPLDSNSFDLTGGNNGSGLSGETDFLWTSPFAGTVQFLWAYTSCTPPNQLPFPDACDSPGWDATGFMVDLTQTQLTDTDTLGSIMPTTFQVNAGSVFGWYVSTLDNGGEPGTLSVSSATFTRTGGSDPGPGTPEPGTSVLVLTGACFLIMSAHKRSAAKLLHNWRTR